MSRIVVAVTGASGAIYARRILGLLSERAGRDPNLEVHWVTSQNAALVWQSELVEPMPESMPHIRRWDRFDFDAPFASGSNPADAFLVAPCSMSTLARVANGGSDDLIGRGCEVALKERHRLILMVRETPLSLVHLRNMVAATEAGATILPAIPSFYAGVSTLQDAVDSVVSRALDHAGIDANLLERWGTAQ